MISEAARERMRAVAASYPERRSALLPVLRIAQEEEGYVTPEGIRAAAEVIGIKPDEAESVASFYSMYFLKPVGQRVVKVCTSIACYLRGCDRVLQSFEREMGIRRGETTPDGKFTLLGVECIASCGTAPAIQVNDEFVENLTPERAKELVAEWRAAPPQNKPTQTVADK